MITNAIPANGNARAIEVVIVGLEFAHNFRVGDFLDLIGGGAQSLKVLGLLSIRTLHPRGTSGVAS